MAMFPEDHTSENLLPLQVVEVDSNDISGHDTGAFR